MKIIDSHMHLFTQQSFLKEAQTVQAKDANYKRAYAHWKDGVQKKFNAPFKTQETRNITELAAAWKKELVKNNIEHALFLEMDEDYLELYELVQCEKQMFSFAASTNPLHNNTDLLEKKITTYGAKAIKLYPTTHGYFLDDKSVYPVYELAQKYSIPIIFHFGITLSFDADLRYASPINLHKVAKEFPSVPFIIAHFGAGYFSDVLLLAYHLTNIFVDTSGTNNWIKYLPYEITLHDVYKKTISVLGDDKIIFGSDSRSLAQGYRSYVLQDQLKILETLGITQNQQENILSQNAQNIFGL